MDVVGEANSGKASKSVAMSSSMGQAQEKALLAKSEIGQAKMVSRPRSFLLCFLHPCDFSSFVFFRVVCCQGYCGGSPTAVKVW